MLYEPTALWGSRQFRNVCFADGHAKGISEAQWPALRSASGIPATPEPNISPWWRFDVKGLREPVRPNDLAGILSLLGLALCGLATLLRLRYAPMTFWQGVGEVIGYGIGYLALTMLLGFVLGLIFLF
jgi:prepilin-type processing-associated H-X9-DG protein